MDVKLDILNAMLAAIGSSSITSTLGRHPGLIRSEPVLNRTNRSVQARGHWFNTEWKLKLLPTVDQEFILPEGILKADTSDKRLPYVRRGRSMYDPTTHSFAIDVDSVEVDAVIMLDYEDLPETAVDLIRAQATYTLVQNSSMDAIGLRAHKDNLSAAKQAFETERLSQSDTSLRSNPNYQRIMGWRVNGGTRPDRIGG